jgi:hypothetical protein
LTSYDAHALLKTIAADHDQTATGILLQVQSRDRLTAKVQRLTAIQQPDANSVQLVEGQAVQAFMRLLPPSADLVIAIDSSLDRIERVDATSALSGIKGVSAVNAGEQAADYLLARVSSQSPTLVANLPAEDDATVADAVPQSGLAQPRNRYALLSQGQNILPASMGEAAEAIKTTLQHLEPRLQALRSLKRLRQLENPNNTSLPITIEVRDADSNTQLAQYDLSKQVSGSPRPGLINLAAGTRLVYRFQQTRRDTDAKPPEQPIYGLVLATEANGTLRLGYPISLVERPQHTETSLDDFIIPTAADPSAADKTIEWTFPGLSNALDFSLFFSCAPFTKTLSAMASNLRWDSGIPSLKLLPNEASIVTALLQDLRAASQPYRPAELTANEGDFLATEAWSTLRLQFQLLQS